MSFDRKIDQVCTHHVVEEALFFNPDRVIVKPLRPISNSASVRVRLNGVANVTPAGVRVPAVGKGSIPGPYSIQAGVNDSLSIAVDNGAVQTVTAAAGKVISAASLARDLSSKISGASFSVTKRGQVQAKTSTRGKAARLIFPSSTLGPILGLTPDRVYRGQQTVPSWSLVTDPNTLADRPARLIVFDSPINGTNDYVEISYTTLRQECRRCEGVGIENDWRYDRRFGEVVKARNAELLVQEVLKITYTDKGSNPFHTWYGTGLLEAIGKKVTNQGLLQNLILNDVQDAFKRWQSIKKQQEKIQDVTDEEYPFRLLVVNLEVDPQDPTIIFVNALVQNRSDSPIQVTRGLQLPVPLEV